MQWFSLRHLTPEQQAFLSQQQPIVLMGRGHSGTRVLSWVCHHLGLNLGVSQDLATGDASDRKFTHQVKKIAIHNIGITQLDDVKPADLARFQRAVFDFYEQLPEPKVQWGWKFPETYLIAPYVAKTFPKARYLHLIRDGRDIAFKEHLSDDPNRELGNLLLAQNHVLGQEHHIQAAVSWAYQVNNFNQFRVQLPKEQILDVRFEDLCLDPQTTVAKIGQFIGCDSITDACQEYIEKIDTGKVSQYREYDHAKIREVERYISPTLERYHYMSTS